MDDLEMLWAYLLSREPEKIRLAWDDLAADEQAAVYAHLGRMATEEGWSEPQRLSAQAALAALEPPAHNDSRLP